MITGDFVNGLHLMQGLSTDNKPTATSENTFFLEQNTGKVYYFSGGSWTQAGDDVALIISAILGGGRDLPVVTDSDDGKVLGVENGAWGLVDSSVDPTAIADAVTDWLDENITEPTEPVVDSSLTVEGAAADAKAVGQALADVITEDIKTALLSLAANCAYANDDGQSVYDALESALYPETHLVSITASYDQDRPIYDTDSLDLVKLDLVVTANYSDGTSEVLDDEDYTLSGTLTAGTSTITVSYGGKTDTIEVIVTESYLPAEYQAVEWVAPDSFAANAITGYIDTGITPTVNTGIEMKLAATSANPERNFFGIRQAQSGANNAFLLQVYSADRKFGYARFGSSVQTASFDNNFHKFVLKTDEVSVDDVAYTLAAPASQTITGQTFRIFGVYVYASSSATYIWQSGGSQKVQYLKIWEDGELVREYVAC